MSALFSRFRRGKIIGRTLDLSIDSVYYVCITELLVPVIFENLSTLKPNFSARVMRFFLKITNAFIRYFIFSPIWTVIDHRSRLNLQDSIQSDHPSSHPRSAKIIFFNSEKRRPHEKAPGCVKPSVLAPPALGISRSNEAAPSFLAFLRK